MNLTEATGTSYAFNMDCMEALRQFPDKHFDLAVVDPPYRDVNHPDQWLRANSGDMRAWPKAPNRSYFIEIKRISAHQIIWGGNYFTEHLPPNNNWIVWHKLNEGVHFSMCELAWSSVRKNIQLFMRPPEKSKIHPTQKPIELYDWIYKNYLPDGGRVIDTHLGSGSNRIAAHKAGNIEFYGYEIDKDYFDAQEKRFKQYVSQLKLF
jgi:site-specific DNA-methyltransferase (adenine-specific)